MQVCKSVLLLLSSLALLACTSSIGQDSAEIAVADFALPNGSITAPFIEKNGVALVGGDMLFALPDAGGELPGASQGAASRGARLWPNGQVPFENPSSIESFDRAAAIWNQYSDQTGITLVPRTDEQDYLSVVSGEGCTSWIGRMGGAQELSLAPACDQSSALHEIGHAIGLIHEHQRQDRDQFITMNWENVVGGEGGRFSVLALARIDYSTSLGPYDLQSIMHYRSYSYENDILVDITQPLFWVNESPLEQIYPTSLSVGDIDGVASLYEAGGSTEPGIPEPEEGELLCKEGSCEEFGLTEGECMEGKDGPLHCTSGCVELTISCS